MPVILGLNFAGWFGGLFATYYVKIYLFAVVSMLNTALGGAIVVCHMMGNPRVSH
jgi:hypothetical protein